MSAPPAERERGPLDTGRPLTGVFWKVVHERHFWELLLEHVDLVEEEDDGCPEEPPRVDHRLKQDEGFLHPVLRASAEV